MNIIEATNKGDLKKVKELLQANPSEIHIIDAYGRTLLHLAIIEGHQELVTFFLEQKLSLEISSASNKNALHYAADYKHEAITKILLVELEKLTPEKQISIITTISKDGKTPWQYANGNNSFNITQLLAHHAISVVKKLGKSKRWIECDDNTPKTELERRLITTLLYKSKRYKEDHAEMQLLKKCVFALNSELGKKSLPELETHIRSEETRLKKFFGSYLSDDSDSDEEDIFNKKIAAEKDPVKNVAKINIKKAQKNKFLPKLTSSPGKYTPSQFFDIRKRQGLDYNNIDVARRQKAQQDLDKLNDLIKKGIPVEEAIEQIETNFFVAQYRGITHLTTKFDKTARENHRKANEIGKPQYSSSVLFAATGEKSFTDLFNAKNISEQQEIHLKKWAELIKRKVVELRNTPRCSYNGYTYENLGELLQDIYSKGYDKFEKLLENSNLLKQFLINSYNPFLSTADVPDHALRYAYGTKPYEGHAADRLRPRWHHDPEGDGRAERPYSGKVYVSLHPLSDFGKDGPIHLVSRNQQGRVNIDNLIISERESSFPGSIPENRVIHQHTAKYPSFKKKYKQIYLYKYGLDEELYNKLKSLFDKAAPHSAEMKYFKQVLGGWLCSYHEVRLIEIAKQEALKRNGFLIYRDDEGLFSFLLPPDSPVRKGVSDEDKKYYADLRNYRRRIAINNREEIRFIFPSSEPRPGNIANYCTIQEFYEAVVTGNIEELQKLFYPDDYLYTVFDLEEDGVTKKTSFLHVAIEAEKLEMAQFLLSRHAPINIRDSDGNTPLHHAAALNNTRLIKLLIDKGADPHIMNNEHFTPREYGENLTLENLENVFLTREQLEQRLAQLEQKIAELNSASQKPSASAPLPIKTM